MNFFECNRNIKFLTVVLSVLLLTCCANDESTIKRSSDDQRTEDTALNIEVNKELILVEEDHKEYILKLNHFYELPVIPELNLVAKSPYEFIPDGWGLIDSVEVDFTKDNLIDFIGVLEVDSVESTEISNNNDHYPRILIGAVQMENGDYKLELQDNTIIRRKNEGGVFGDPYLPISYDKQRLVLESFGGSNSKWNEIFTLNYSDGEWYVTRFEVKGNIGPYSTYNYINDYESRIGTREYNSELFELVEERVDAGWDLYDLSFCHPIDQPERLSVYSEKLKLHKPDFEIISIKEIEISSRMQIDESWISNVKQEAQQIGDLVYIDSEFILYTFSVHEFQSEFLAIVNRGKETVQVVERIDKDDKDYSSNFRNIALYDNHIYFTQAYEFENSLRLDLKSFNIEESEMITVLSLDFNKPDSEYFSFLGTELEVYNEVIVFGTYQNGESTYYSINLNSNQLKVLGNIR